MKIFKQIHPQFAFKKIITRASKKLGEGKMENVLIAWGIKINGQSLMRYLRNHKIFFLSRLRALTIHTPPATATAAMRKTFSIIID